jgi:hypothetical protein
VENSNVSHSDVAHPAMVDVTSSNEKRNPAIAACIRAYRKCRDTCKQKDQLEKGECLDDCHGAYLDCLAEAYDS